jgi:hypothetical protein
VNTWIARDAPLLGEEQPAKEASLRLLGIGLEVGVGLFERRGDLALLVELLRFAQVVGGCGPRGRGDPKAGREEAGTDGHAAIIC